MHIRCVLVGLTADGAANCSAWDTTFGIMHRGGFNHLLLANTQFWAPSGWTIPRLFARLFGDYASSAMPAVGGNYQYIWEPDIAGRKIKLAAISSNFRYCTFALGVPACAAVAL